MRIKQLSVQNVIGEKEVDFYVPVSIYFKDNDEADKMLFYYRMLNPKSSFVEVSINSVTSKIVYITLVSINDVEETANVCLSFPKKEGNPIIDMEVFKEEYIVTNNVNFNIYIRDKKIYVLQETTTVCKQVKMDAVSLLLDGRNNIIGFVFEDFSDDEWNEINDCIGRL